MAREARRVTASHGVIQKKAAPREAAPLLSNL